MPPDRLCQLTREKPADRIMSANAAGLGNLRIELDEILIGLGIAGDGAAERRDHLEREQVIEPIEPGHIDGREFQAEEAAAGPQHAIRFRKRMVDPRHVADAEGDGVAVEGAIGKRQRFRIAFDKGDAIVEMARDGALLSDAQHVRIDVADGGAKTVPAAFAARKAISPVPPATSSSANVPLAFGRIEGVDHDVFPDAVQPARHQVVHQIVARGHAVKHRVHKLLLVLQRHVAEAKMGGLVGPIHHAFTLVLNRTIARPAQWGYHVTSIR